MRGRVSGDEPLVISKGKGKGRANSDDSLVPPEVRGKGGGQAIEVVWGRRVVKIPLVLSRCKNVGVICKQNVLKE